MEDRGQGQRCLEARERRPDAVVDPVPEGEVLARPPPSSSSSGRSKTASSRLAEPRNAGTRSPARIRRPPSSVSAGREGGCAPPGWKRRSSSTAAPHASAALRRPSRAAGCSRRASSPFPIRFAVVSWPANRRVTQAPTSSSGSSASVAGAISRLTRSAPGLSAATRDQPRQVRLELGHAPLGPGRAAGLHAARAHERHEVGGPPAKRRWSARGSRAARR